MTSVRAAPWRWVALVLVLTGGLGIEAITQQPADATGGMFPQTYDARTAFAGLAAVEPGTSQRARLAALQQDILELEATFDATTGVTRTLWSRTGYLTQPQPGPAIDIADAFIASNLAMLGLIDEDVGDRELTDLVFSQVTGATHVYYRQRHGGIPVYATQLQVNVNRDGRILSVNNSFVPAIGSGVNATVPAIDAASAVQGALQHLQGAPSAASTGPQRAHLMVLPIQKGVARLVWNFQIDLADGSHAYDFTVDAETGQVWTRYDRVWAERYKVYPQPVESPIHVAQLPPRDARSIVFNPAHPAASPFGWHDADGVPGAESTLMVGNNVHAYDDSAAANRPPTVQPDCGSLLDCIFPVWFVQTPSVYSAAAVANLFYWNNIVHDVQYLYGFDEAAGNFQLNNYGRGGALALGNDSVQAEAQDSLMLNNAYIYVPPDGQPPRMQMFLWTHTEPARDSDLDSGVIVHEYGHGISARQVGGPSNVDCLRNAQQPGEGLSDWLALVYTAQASDTGGMPRGAATYLLGQPTTGPGVRGVPYSADPAVNNWTYESIAGKAIPHGVGAVWAQGMWRVYWALVDRHGSSTDLYGVHGAAGNQRAMLYVNEGMKNVVCNPTFTDMRDAIMQSAVDNYGGADVCLMWTAFAAFGLGVDAISHGPSSTSPRNGYGVPEACVTSPPEASTPFYPLERVGERRQEFGWKYVANASWYQLWITDTTGVRTHEWHLAATAGCSNAETFCRITPEVDLNAGPAWWWVRTWNAAGYGPWSPAGTFLAGPPEPPSLGGPRGQIDTALPTYRWNPSVSATWYRLWVDDAAGHRFDQWYPESALFCYPPESLCRITPAVALHPGAANFWVQSWNAFGASPWSLASSFTVPEVASGVRFYSDGKLWIDDATLRDVPAAIAGLSAGEEPCASTAYSTRCVPR
jgi:extracellular elastinolytic metalloproteinase